MIWEWYENVTPWDVSFQSVWFCNENKDTQKNFNPKNLPKMKTKIYLQPFSSVKAIVQYLSTSLVLY